MIGASDFHPSGHSARRSVAARHRGQHHAMRLPASFQRSTAPTLLKKILVGAARLRRFLNGRVAASIARHEQQAASFAQREFEQRRPNSTRIYCGPIDQVLAAARFRRAA